jgi:beta-glucanase (GH16 family)
VWVQPIALTLERVSDLHEVTASPNGEPPPPRRRRVVLLVLACVVIAALVSLLVVALRGSGSGRSTSGGSTASQGSGITLDPAERSDSEAAMRNGWKMVAHDEFDGAALDEDHWSPYKGRTTDDVGQHDPDNLSVSDGTLKLTSRGDTSAGLAWDDGQKYGRWEARVRSEKGNGFGPVMLLWPDAEDWPEGGEIDIMEIPKGDRTKAIFTVHWGEDNQQDGKSVQGDFTQWHNFAVEWTPDHIVGYVDGEEIYRTDNADAIPPRSMHFAMQQDIGPYGKDWIPAPDASTPATCTFEIDWVRIYAP